MDLRYSLHNMLNFHIHSGLERCSICRLFYIFNLNDYISEVLSCSSTPFSTNYANWLLEKSLEQIQGFFFFLAWGVGDWCVCVYSIPKWHEYF